MKRLQFCCGRNYLVGWDNYDTDCDISRPLPFPDDYADYIYIEHGIEHITREQALSFLMECNRIMKSGGRMRIAFPDVARIAISDDKEFNFFVTKFAGIPGTDVRSAIRAVSLGFDHEAMWTVRLLKPILKTAGFIHTKKCEIGVSEDENLRDLESHCKRVGKFEKDVETSVLEATRSQR